MQKIIDGITNINNAVNGVVWGVPMLIFIIGVGIIMTAGMKFFQISHFGYWMKETFLGIFRKKSVTKHTDKNEKTISQFQALSTALAATIGTGNIAGVATAIAIGGPGAVFWMWISAIFGMMTNYSENVLGIFYRRKNEKGEWSGGAMYYLRDGLGKKKGCKHIGAILAVLFSAFCLLASFGIGNMTQINSIASAMEANFGIPTLVMGIILAIIATLVIVGGIKRIGTVTEKLVPFMAVFYIIGCLIVFFMNIENVPYVFSSIFKSAFSFAAVGGGVGGYIIKRAATMGFKRGVFSNEAGLGSSVMVHSASNVKEPVMQGMWGIFEVFFDTIIVCTLTAFVLLSSVTGTASQADAFKNITKETQYFSIAEHISDDETDIPLIDAEINDIVKLKVDDNKKALLLSEKPDTESVEVIVDSQPYYVETATSEGEGDYVYTNIMSVKANYDEGGSPVTLSIDKIDGVPLVTYAFSNVFGAFAGKLLSVAILLFAFSTVLGWSYYGTKAWEFLFGTKATIVYKAIFIVIIVFGATMSLQLAWDLADTFNALMAIPNLIGVLALAGTVFAITRNYVGRKIKKNPSGEKPMLSAFDDIQAEQEKALDDDE